MEISKQQLRRELKNERLAMNYAEVSANSAAITQNLIDKVDWAGIKNMHVYSDVLEWNEVQTGSIIEYVGAQWPKIEVTLAGTESDQQLPKRQFDLIVAPCLGFDDELYRLGLGAGFYDRFLANQAKALKIGLCFAAGLVKPGLPHEPHDIPLDKIITEEGIINPHDS
jgi:5-formyltetrahydrofolate cyclo-ligase